MTYEQQILQILTDVGERGISVQLLSRHVYNINVSLFSTPDMDEIKSFVRSYIQKNSRSPQSLLERTARRGFYRLNTSNNADARQLLLRFTQVAAPEESEEPVSQQDFSLDLFA